VQGVDRVAGPWEPVAAVGGAVALAQLAAVALLR
jgi:hypothetical protein